MQTLEEVTNFLNREAELQKMKDEIKRLREALQFYTCGCKEDRCTPDKQRFRDIKCGWVAREALGGK